MCRLLGYLGPRIDLWTLLYGPPFGLERQAWEPRRQQYGSVNADGWGIGWYDRDVRAEPARYRTVTPMWADRNFAEIAPLLSSDCVVAAVRDASPGMPVDQSATAPFMCERYLFAHNGLIDGFRTGVGTSLRRELSSTRESQILGGTDSEVAFAMLLDRLQQALVGSSPDALPVAVRDTIAAIRSVSGGRLNFLVTDGHQLVASRSGDSLYVIESSSPTGEVSIVASEPFDDDPKWCELPEESIVIARRGAPTEVVSLTGDH